MDDTELEQRNLVLRPRAGSGEKVYWDAQWRFRTEQSEPWRLKKQRLGFAWLERDGRGGWRKRRGRCRPGWLDERAALGAAEAAMSAQVRAVAVERERARRAGAQLTTVRALAAHWLSWLEQVRGAKPSTIRDYQTLLREPKLQSLRHAAGSILARVADPVFVRDYLGHSKLSTTDRYVSAKHRPEDFERLNRAFAPAQSPEPSPDAEEIV